MQLVMMMGLMTGSWAMAGFWAGLPGGSGCLACDD